MTWPNIFSMTVIFDFSTLCRYYLIQFHGLWFYMHEVSWKRNRKCSSMHVLSLFSGWGHKIIQRNISIFIRFCMCTKLWGIVAKDNQFLGNLSNCFVKSSYWIPFTCNCRIHVAQCGKYRNSLTYFWQKFR